VLLGQVLGGVERGVGDAGVQVGVAGVAEFTGLGGDLLVQDVGGLALGVVLGAGGGGGKGGCADSDEEEVYGKDRVDSE
jgi:hypothetical protein